MTGAKINKIKFLCPSFRKSEKCRKCPVCERYIHKGNRIGLCTTHGNMERALNLKNQPIRK